MSTDKTTTTSVDPSKVLADIEKGGAKLKKTEGPKGGSGVSDLVKQAYLADKQDKQSGKSTEETT